LADSSVGLAAWFLDHGDGYGQPAAAITSAVLYRPRLMTISRMDLKAPNHLKWDNRLTEADRLRVDDLNASLERLNGLRAVEINVSGPFARSKNQCTLSAMLSARAFMETLAMFAEFERRVRNLFAVEDLDRLNALADRGIFASRDAEWIKEFPETEAMSVLTYIDKFDKRIEGFRGHYDMLSERCHPNSAGHNFMFSKLDRSDGTVRFCNENEPERNGQMILAALTPLPLVESISSCLDDLILKVADLHHRAAPEGGAR
jgi:hypothetical protein